MCGIAGFFDPDRRIDPATYDRTAGAMADRLAHRGPDGRGVWSDPAAGIALGFRRLAILDLSPAGDQPMHSSDGRVVLVFNGEIYNHRELRRALDAETRIDWRGRSDTEVLAEAIARWGMARTLERANGMFAIAAWERGDRRLHLARDRLGEKPLYFGWLGGTLAFASELKALRQHPSWQGRLDHGAVALFLSYAYVPAPWSAFEGVCKLLPGHVATFASGSRAVEEKAYWSAPERADAAAARPFRGTAAEGAEALQALVDDAVALRLESDVPLGAFLSGGIDSSTVLAAMRRATGAPVRSFCVGFPQGFDEAPFAASVARHLGTEHTTLAADETALMATLPDLARIYDEPFADPSQLPTVLLCRSTREHVTVSLSGDGGDELFGGYDRYTRAARAWRRLEARPLAVRRALRAGAALLDGRDERPLRRLRRRLENGAHETPESLYRDYVTNWRPGDGMTRLVPSASPADRPLAGASLALEQRLMLRDAVTYLPDDLLVKIDRASMSCGLEVRAPLLDHRIAEFAWSLPPALTVEGGGKTLLRQMLADRVPRALVDRPKQGFDPPLARWLREGLRPWADALLAPDRLKRRGLVEPGLVARRWRAHREGRRNWARALWPILMLEAWLDTI
jgi:asparagine synthase (glutamine-hydrolysing)